MAVNIARDDHPDLTAPFNKLFGLAFSVPAVVILFVATLGVLLFLFGFWWFSHGWLLEPLDELPDSDDQDPLFLRDIYADRNSPAR